MFLIGFYFPNSVTLTLPTTLQEFIYIVYLIVGMNSYLYSASDETFGVPLPKS